MLTVVVVLVLFEAMSLPLFLTAALVGFLVLVEMSTPRYVRPLWTVRARRLAIVGLVAFSLYFGYRLQLLAQRGAM